jgi:glycosyltransferase involved in cell wall biosynthesis
MACGAPVIATGRGGSDEYLREGENCVLFDPDAGPRALADAVHRVAGDAELRGRLHDGGLATAAQFPESAFNDAVLEALHRAREGAVAEVGSRR